MTSPNTPDKLRERLGDCAFSAPSLSSFGSSPSASLPVSPPLALRSTIASAARVKLERQAEADMRRALQFGQFLNSLFEKEPAR